MTHLIRIAAALTLLAGHAPFASGLPAQAAPAAHSASDRPMSRLPGGYLAGLAGREPVFGETADGALLVLGNTYRMTFEPGAATYAPFLGSDAPRTWPVRLAVRSVRTDAGAIGFAGEVEPVREGTRVTYDRGPFAEVWDVAYESVELTFVVRERTGPGALVIEIDVASDLARSHGDGGLALEGELGGVRCSYAVAIDARGERIAAPTRWRDGGIEIEVPAADLARLAFPLVVDPVLTTFSIDVGGTGVVSSPVDAAYDPTDRTWCFVNERLFAGGVRDAHVQFVPEITKVHTNFAIQSISQTPLSPRVALNRAAGRFLVVVSVAGLTGGQRIRGVLYENTATTADPSWGPATSLFFISPDDTDAVNCDVGGDGSTATPGHYCVVWQRMVDTTDNDILVQMVRTNGMLLGPPMQLSGNADTVNGTPSISSSNGKSRSPAQHWTIAWMRSAGFLTYDLYAGRVRWDGFVSDAAFAIDTTVTDTRYPSVSSPTDEPSPITLVAYMRGNVGSTKTYGYVLEGSTVRANVNLTSLTGADADEAHLYPNVDCDGRAFVLVDTETWLGTTLHAIYASTLTWFGDALHPTESHVQVAALSNVAQAARIACERSPIGPAHRSLITYSYGDDDLRGAYYAAGSFTSFCHPGRDGVPACPCGNAPSGPGRGCDNAAQTGGGRLAATGGVEFDTVTLVASGLKPSTVCVFVQTFANASTGTPFGDGVQCTTGTARRLGAKQASGGVASYPGVGNPSISARSAALGDPILPGTQRHYFVFYRDQNPTWACGELFNVTSALRVAW